MVWRVDMRQSRDCSSKESAKQEIMASDTPLALTQETVIIRGLDKLVSYW